MAQLASAAVSDLLPAGPELRQRQAIALRGQPGIEVTDTLSATEMERAARMGSAGLSICLTILLP